MTELEKVLVVGGGIAGLSAAIALGRAGFKVMVVEKAESADGAAITITNRGVDALAELGVLEACITGGRPGMAGTMFSAAYNAAGDRIQIPPLPVRPDDGLPSYVTIYRPVLAHILSDEAERQGATIRRGMEVLTLDDGENGVEAKFGDGTTERFDLVVAADGAQSATRKRLFGDQATPAYTGHMSLRWVVQDGPEGEPGFYMHPDGRPLVINRLPGNLVYMATGFDLELRWVTPEEGRAELAGILDAFGAPFIRALRERLTNEAAVIVRPYEWIMLPKPWHKGRIVVIGDAAHSMTAHMSSGGSMGVEDGVVLGQEIARAGDLESALVSFEDRRFHRTKLVVDASVQLMRLQQAGAHPAELHKVRGATIEALLAPY